MHTKKNKRSLKRSNRYVLSTLFKNHLHHHHLIWCIQEIALLNTQWKSEKERADREEERANKLEAELLSELEKAKEHSEMLAKSLPALSRLVCFV